MKLSTAWILLPTLLLAACAGLPPSNAVINPDLPGDGPVPLINVPKIALFQGRPVWAHYNARNQIVFQALGDKAETIIGHDSPPGSALSYLQLHTDSRGVYVFWRPKLRRAVDGVGRPGDKVIYMSASHDGKTFGPAVRLNQQGGAFEPIVAGNGRGDVYAVWVDERNGGGNYDIYFNASHDAGRTWAAADTRLDPGRPGDNPSYDPRLAVENDKVFVAWTEAGQTKRLMVRLSTDRARTWKPPVEIARSDLGPTGLQLVKLPAERGGRLVLYWFNQQEFWGAYSEDDGGSWKTFNPLPGVTDVAELKVTQDPSGRVLLVAGLLPEQKKEDLVFAASDDGVNFTPPARLDIDDAHAGTSTAPEIATDGKGRILVAWHDRRAFRDQVFFNYSQDGGKTWLARDLALAGPEVKHMEFPRFVADGEGGFRLVAVGYDTDKRGQPKSHLYRIVPGEPWPVPHAKPADPERLRERVAKFWGDRGRSDWGGNYDLMDPFFRIITTREYYIANQFKTIYHGFELKDIKLVSNSALVTIKYSLEIPEVYLQSGQRVSVPKRDEEITEEWIWMDNDWYRVFKDVMGQSFVPR